MSGHRQQSPNPGVPRRAVLTTLGGAASAAAFFLGVPIVEELFDFSATPDQILKQLKGTNLARLPDGSVAATGVALFRGQSKDGTITPSIVFFALYVSKEPTNDVAVEMTAAQTRPTGRVVGVPLFSKLERLITHGASKGKALRVWTSSPLAIDPASELSVSLQLRTQGATVEVDSGPVAVPADMALLPTNGPSYER